jgi:chromatin remodeling complex protein RSC6
MIRVYKMPAKKTTSKKTSSKVTKVSQPAPAPAPVPVPEPVEQPTTETLVSTENPTDAMFKSILADLQTQKSAITLMIANVKKLQKDYSKEVKMHQKKKKGTGKKREPSGFAKPTKLSKELCDFLGKSEGTEMARTEVTKYLTEYIKTQNLQYEKDKRTILPDAKLSKLLFKSKKDEGKVTYFNLQKWMKPHFSKESSSA